MIRKIPSVYFFIVLILALSASFSARAETVNVDASRLIPRAEVFFSPRAGSFVEGSTFDVPIIVNTKGTSINGVEVRVNFDKDKLSIVQATGGTSVVGVWVEPPSYDNTKGTANYVGVMPGGIKTDSGLIGTITFKAKNTGAAIVSLNYNSKIFLNDGLGTEAAVDLGRSGYTIIPKAPEGVKIYSETHPSQGDWYRNRSPVISWEKGEGVKSFSYILDSRPDTIPDNETETRETTLSFEDLDDGLWYFHIKANKGVVWGTTGTFLIRIDSAPPADFRPQINYLLSATVLAERALVSFFTTDNLSGVDHYEVGVIDKSQPITISPIFVQTESPFQVPLTEGGRPHVIIRAFDEAGNIREVSTNVGRPFFVIKFIKDYLFYILFSIVFIGFATLAIRYFLAHHIVRNFRRFVKLLKREEQIEEKRDSEASTPGDDVPK